MGPLAVLSQGCASGMARSPGWSSGSPVENQRIGAASDATSVRPKPVLPCHTVPIVGGTSCAAAGSPPATSANTAIASFLTILMLRMFSWPASREQPLPHLVHRLLECIQLVGRASGLGKGIALAAFQLHLEVLFHVVHRKGLQVRQRRRERILGVLRVVGQASW